MSARVWVEDGDGDDGDGDDVVAYRDGETMPEGVTEYIRFDLLANSAAEIDTLEAMVVSLRDAVETMRRGRVYDVAAMILASQEVDEDESDDEAMRRRSLWWRYWRKRLPGMGERPHEEGCKGNPIRCFRCRHDAYVAETEKLMGGESE